MRSPLHHPPSDAGFVKPYAWAPSHRPARQRSGGWPAQGVLEEVNLLQDITLATRAMVGAFVEDRTDDEGRISSDSFAGLARRIGFRAQPWEEAIKVRPLRLVYCHKTLRINSVVCVLAHSPVHLQIRLALQCMCAIRYRDCTPGKGMACSAVPFVVLTFACTLFGSAEMMGWQHCAAPAGA